MKDMNFVPERQSKMITRSKKGRQRNERKLTNAKRYAKRNVSK